MTHRSSPFAKALLREQMRRRALVEHGDRGARTSPLWPDWRRNLHPALLPRAEALVASGSLPLHSHAHALNSSQAFALNLFLPLALGPSPAVDRRLSELLREDVRVTSVDLEFFGSGDLLAEIPTAIPGPDDKLTAADAAIHLRDADDRPGVLLVEVKLSESGFTPCGGAASRGNRDRAPCESAAVFFADPARCYLRRPYRAARDRRYWSIFAAAHGSIATAFPGRPATGACPFLGDWQQPMRNHALALALAQDEQVAFWHLALVHHDGNPDVPGPWDAYAAATADAPRLHRWPATSLLPALAAPVGHEAWMRSRYVLDQEVP